MAQFSYKIMDKAGKTKKGTIEADSIDKAKNMLIEHNLRLVVYIAKKFENTGVSLEDLTSIGTIGLIKAVNSFNNEKSIKGFGDWDNTLYKRGFVTIINEFLDAIKYDLPLPVNLEDSIKTHKLCEEIVELLI